MKLNYKLRGTKQGSLLDIALANRGLTIDRVDQLLNMDKNALVPLETLDNINKGCNVLLSALEQELNITLIQDCDVDGVTSASILYRYIKRAYPEAKIKVIFHLAKGHGTSDDIEIPKDTQLLLIPDASIQSNSIAKKLDDMDVKVIIIDHHNTDLKYEEFDNIVCINPQHSEGYTNKHISGAGVVYRVCQMLDKKLNKDYADDYLDLVGLGNLSDNMDSTVDETRYLINQSININNIKNPWYKYCLEQIKPELEKLTLGEVSWGLSPKINAVCRAGTQEEKELLFNGVVSDAPEDIFNAWQSMTKSKSRQDREKKKIINYCNKYIKDNDLLTKGFICIDITEVTDNTGFSGVVAGNISDAYNRPCFVYAGKKEVVRGSIRNNNEVICGDFNKWLNETGLVIKAEGHAQACGLVLNKANLSALIEAFDNYIKENNKSIDKEKTYEVDAIISSEELKMADIYSITQYNKLWATTLKEPTFAITGIKLPEDKIEKVGARGGRLNMFYNNITYTKPFLSNELWNRAICSDDTSFGSKFIELNVVGKFVINEYNGKKFGQVEIIDLDAKVIPQKEVTIDDIF